MPTSKDVEEGLKPGPNSVHVSRLRAAQLSARGAKICFLLAQVSAQALSEREGVLV